jgi:hypothetical protein
MIYENVRRVKSGAQPVWDTASLYDACRPEWFTARRRSATPAGRSSTSHQPRGASAYARKTAPPAHALRVPRRPGWLGGRRVINLDSATSRAPVTNRRRRGSERLRRGFRYSRSALAALRRAADGTLPIGPRLGRPVGLSRPRYRGAQMPSKRRRMTSSPTW